MIVFEIFIIIIFLIILAIGFRSEFILTNKPEPFDESSQSSQSVQLKQGSWYPYNPENYYGYWGWKPYNGLWPYYNPWWYYPYPFPTPIGYNSCVSNLQ